MGMHHRKLRISLTCRLGTLRKIPLALQTNASTIIKDNMGQECIIIYLSIYLPIYLSIYIYLSISIYIYLSIYLPIHSSIHLAIDLSIHPSIHLAIDLSIHLNVFIKHLGTPYESRSTAWLTIPENDLCFGL